MQNGLVKRIIAAFMSAVLVSSCATMGGGGPATEVDKAMGQCLAAVAIGAIAGAIIGNNTGSGNAQRGAATGALLGVGVCVVLLAMANERDKQTIAQLQAQSAATGSNQRTTYRGDDGRLREVRTSYVGDVADPEAPPMTTASPVPETTSPRLCRRVNATMNVEGAPQPANVNNQIVCRNPDGQWALLETANAPNVT